MKQIIQFFFASLELTPRTILARFGIKKKYISQDLSNKTIDTKLIEFNSKKYFDLLPREIKIINNNKVSIHHKKFKIKDLLINKINKKDYLQTYTFHYLNFKNYSHTKNKTILNKILKNKISNEPFVNSQQLFNLIFYNELFKSINNEIIKKKYYDLCNSIEYHVDANHVLENFISIILIETLYDSLKLRSLEFLYNELSRQNYQGWHIEKNLKYFKDLLIKIKIILLLIRKKNNFSIIKKIEEIINEWEFNLLNSFRSLPLVNDNIEGDALKIQIEKYLSIIQPINYKLKKNYLFQSLPKKGFRGHSFDSNFLLPIGCSFFAFGTYTYSDSIYRKYQRLRKNNLQPYYYNSDVSHFFYKSFRSILKLPFFLKKNKNDYKILEFILSKNLIPKILIYEYFLSKNTIKIKSSTLINLDLFTFNLQGLKKTKRSLIYFHKNKRIELFASKFKIKRSLRASGINKLTYCFRIILSGKEINIKFK